MLTKEESMLFVLFLLKESSKSNIFAEPLVAKSCPTGIPLTPKSDALLLKLNDTVLSVISVASLGDNSLGRNIRFSISELSSINELIVDNVQGKFITGIGNTIKYETGIGSTAINGGNVYVEYIDIETEESDGLHIKVNHKNHGMHSSANDVLISGVYSDLPPTFLQSQYLQNSSGSAQIFLSDMLVDLNTGLSQFEIFENVQVSQNNPGYILIDNEIISYSSVNVELKTLNGITREIDQTRSFTYNPGTPVFKYELSGVSLRRINKKHFLQNSDIEKSINLDSYYIKLDMSSADKTDSRGLPYSQVDRSSSTINPDLYINQTKNAGGSNVYATQNIAFEIVKPILELMDLTGTNLTAKIRTISGTSADGLEESYIDQGFETINIKENTYLSSPRIIASKINEDSKLINLPGNKTFTFNLNLSTSNENLSPVIDLDRVGMIFTSNRIDSVVDDYVSDFRVSTLKDDPSSFVYATNPIPLGIPATSIKIIASAHVNTYSDLRAFYAVLKDSTEEPIYYPFPGYNNLYKSGEVIDLSNSDGNPDSKVDKSEGNGFLSIELSYRDYEFSINNLPEFRLFSIKFIGTSENQAYPPRLKGLRVIALA